MPTLYLIPITIADDSIDYIPPITLRVLHELDCFFVERIRTARRFIKSLDSNFNINAVEFIEMDKRDMNNNYTLISSIISTQRNFSIMSESGLPCIADPGYQIVDRARKAGYNIRPLSGPGSIYMALMASGLNGQQFVFHGYLPIKDRELNVKLKNMADEIMRTGYTHLFIETPYRNERMLTALLKIIPTRLKLTLAMDISGAHESIKSKSIGEWKDTPKEPMPKVPCIFLLGI